MMIRRRREVVFFQRKVRLLLQPAPTKLFRSQSPSFKIVLKSEDMSQEQKERFLAAKA